MNLLELNSGGEYTSKMTLVKVILYIIGICIFIPAIYTNYLFFQMFFDVKQDNTFVVFLLYLISGFIEICKFISLFTLVSILFNSLKEDRKYFDLISFSLYILIAFASIFFQYEGLQHKTFFEVEKVASQADSLQTIQVDTIQKTGVSVKDRTNHLQATASVLDAIVKNNELKVQNIAEKTSRTQKLKDRLIDKRFFFILFCEFLGIFCCISIAYLEYKADIEQIEIEADGNEDIKKIQAKFRSAVRRGATHLIDKYKAELNALGAKIPKH